MRNVLVYVFAVAGLLLSTSVNAQYCGGNPGNNVCTASTTLNSEGFSPTESNLPCIIIGQPYSQVIQMHTPSTYNNGFPHTIQTVQIDSISNLPCGLCWTMDQNANFTINGNATGCFRISGTTFDAPGEYELRIIADITPTFGFPQTQQDMTGYGLKYFVRVRLPGDTCIQIDTLGPGKTATASGSISAPVITGSSVVCATGGNTTLTATGTGYYAYAWSTGSFSSTATITSPGTYTVTVYGACTSATASKTITVSSVSDTITAAGPTSFCPGGSVTLSVPSGSSYQWSTGATTSSISATAATTYFVTVTNALGCTAVSSGFPVTYKPIPADTISASGPLIFCPGGNVTLSGPPGLTYQWSDGATTQSITVSQSAGFTLIVTGSNNCTAISSMVTVTESGVPDNSVTDGGPVTFCPGDSVTLAATVGLTYQWSNGDTTQSITVYQAGSYSLTLTNSYGCTAVSPVTNVVLLQAPNNTITASGPLSLCSGGSVELTAAPGLAYSWSGGSNAESITVSHAGSYTVTVTNADNCSAVSQPAVITVTPTPDDTVTVSGPTTICSGASVTLSAIAGYTYQWSTGATTQSISVNQGGNYIVTISNGTSCSATSAPVTVSVSPAPNNTVSINNSTTFCSGGSITLTAQPGLNYQWTTGAATQAITVTQTGSYAVTVTNANNCSAVSSPPVNVTVLPLPNATVTANGPTAFCPGGSVILTATSGFTYVWNNSSTSQSITVSQGGNYTVTVSNSNHCTVAVSGPTVVLNSPTTISFQPVSQVTCIGGQVTFSVTADGDNIVYQWQKNGINIGGQQSSTYGIASAALSDTGSYRVVISGVCGSDTSNAASLSVAGSLTFSQQPLTQTVCLGNRVSFTVVANGVNTTYQWIKNGQNITNAHAATYTINTAATTDTGHYSCYVTSSCGNATSNMATLTVNLPTSSAISQTICAGKTYNFNGHLLTTGGTYRDTLNNAHACDSVITLTLTVSPPLTHTYYDSLCAGSTYNFNGTLLSSPGTYKDTVITTGGCDSIVTLQLAFKQPTSSTTNASICQGGTYHFNGMALTTPGTYQDTLTSHNGCDSIAIVHLTVNQATYNTVNATVCGNRTYNFNGRAISTAGTYFDTIPNAHGCDSIITLHLSTTPSVTTAYSASICSGNLYNFNGRIVTSPGVYIDTIPASGGCDSIVTLRLTVNQATGSSVIASVCSGSTYAFGGHTLSTSGVYYDTLINSHGCDSIITLNLTVDAAIRTGIHAAVCSGRSYLFDGQQLSTSGTYIAHFTAHNGCDSMVTLVLQVGPYVTSNISGAVCSGSSYNFNGRILTSAGTYNDTLTAQGGCDSIVILQLSVVQPTAATINAAICPGGSYTFNGQQITQAGNYTETLTAASGCDSVVTLSLQVNTYLTTSLADTICQGSSYNFNGQSLSAPGMYYDTLTAHGGCDSIVALNLAVSHTSSSTINASICVGSSYLFNGVQLRSTGTYFEALNGINGCDSIVTLHLVVNSFITTNLPAHICYGSFYNFYGRHVDTTGSYVDTLNAQGGCDSLVVLNLTVDSVIIHHIGASICANGTYFFNGHTISTPGTYRDTLVTAGGCDSINILNLITTQALTSTLNESTCAGTPYNFNGRALNAAGVYTDTLTAQAGCDSVVTLNLSVNPAFNFISDKSICSGSSYPFNGHNLSVSGTYYDSLTTRHGCDSVFTLNLSIIPPPVITWPQADTICNNNDTNHITIAAPSPAGGTLTGNGLNGLVLTISGSGTYPVTYSYVDTSGCSNSVTKNLVIESCLGIEPVASEPVISVYPNPANDIIIAQGDVLADGHITPLVYDMMGKLMELPFLRQADKLSFNTSKLAAGMYLIKFNINGKVISKHFVKQAE